MGRERGRRTVDEMDAPTATGLKRGTSVMKFGRFELIRLRQDVSLEDNIRRSMEKIELGYQMGVDETPLAGGILSCDRR